MFSSAEGRSTNCVIFAKQINAVKYFHFYSYFEDEIETLFVDLFVITMLYMILLGNILSLSVQNIPRMSSLQCRFIQFNPCLLPFTPFSANTIDFHTVVLK